MKLLIIPALALIAQNVLANENLASRELNLSDNAQYLALSDITGAIDSGVKIVMQFGRDTYAQVKELATKYGPDAWGAALQYGPQFVNWLLNNQDKIFKLADGVKQFNDEKAAPKPVVKALPAPPEVKLLPAPKPVLVPKP